MPKKKTHKEYEEELFENEIECWPVETYIDSYTPIMHECINGHQWKAWPGNILQGKGCKICFSGSGGKINNHERYTNFILENDIEYVPLEDYVNSKTPITHECARGHQWKITPNHVMKGHGCPKCNLVGGYNATRFQRDKELANSPGILYAIVLVNKATKKRECVKIGITKGTSNRDVLKRTNGFIGYEPRIQKLVHGTLEQVFNLEQYLHNKWKSYHYTSEWKFGGHSELFSIDKLSDILQSIPSKI